MNVLPLPVLAGMPLLPQIPPRRPRRYGFNGKGLVMRRLWLTLLGLCGLGLAGCHHTCSHGICDCTAIYDDHCCTRAPWVQYGPAPAVLGAPVGAVEAVPAKGY